MNDQIPDTRPGFYYVSVVRDDGAHRLLRGPFVNDHPAALAAVDGARHIACKLDRRGHWYAYGTCRTETDAGPGILDHRCDADCAPYLVDDECTVCGVVHTRPCALCGGRGYHTDACSDPS